MAETQKSPVRIGVGGPVGAGKTQLVERLTRALAGAAGEAARRGVYLVSPGTLWAVLGAMRALMRDVRLRSEAQQLRREVLCSVGDSLVVGVPHCFWSSSSQLMAPPVMRGPSPVCGSPLAAEALFLRSAMTTSASGPGADDISCRWSWGKASYCRCP